MTCRIAESVFSLAVLAYGFLTLYALASATLHCVLMGGSFEDWWLQIALQDFGGVFFDGAVQSVWLMMLLSSCSMV